MKLKISTLFHWLYATLMFLPILMFIPSCLYYGFNEHATNTETTTINYKYESNEVNTFDDLVVGNIYNVYFNNNSLDEYFLIDGYLGFEVLEVKQFNFENYEGVNLEDFVAYAEGNPGIHFYFNITSNTSTFNIYFLSDDYTFDIYIGDLYSEAFTFEFIGKYILSTSTQMYINPFSYTDYNEIESVSVNTDDTITQKVATAWERTWDLPLFAWTQNSFITAPFSYITGLFGLGSDNSLNYVFTYFASISICWLVFDLIMYVPNLAHRWLDRSAIE